MGPWAKAGCLGTHVPPGLLKFAGAVIPFTLHVKQPHNNVNTFIVLVVPYLLYLGHVFRR